MATLAISLAGAAVGGFTGIGANTGFLIGSILARVLFPPDPIRIEGPRLGDLTVSASTYGTPIPLGYGTVPIAGQLIWSSGKREVQQTTETGGKGGALSGPGQVQVTYIPFADLAYSFAGREAQEITRLWMNGVLVFDKRGQVTVQKPGLIFRVYKGTETQLPDPLIEVKEGVGSVPAHRGTVYVVFESLNLSDFGGRVPTVTAEIAFAAINANTLRFSDDIEVSEGGISGSIQTDQLAVDFKRRRIYLHDATAPDVLRVYDYDSLLEIRQKLTSEITTADRISARGLYAGQDTGRIYARVGTGTTEELISIDPNTLDEIARSAAVSWNVKFMVEATVIGADGSKDHYLVVASNIGASTRLSILDADTMTVLATDLWVGKDNSIIGVVLGRQVLGKAEVWILQSASVNDEIDVWKLEIEPGAALLDTVLVGVDLTLIDTIDSLTAWGDNAAATAKKPAVYDAQDDSLIFIVNDIAAGVNSLLFKWREGDGIVWTSAVNTAEPIQVDTLVSVSRLKEGLFGFADSAGNASMIDTTDGTVIVNGFDGTSLDASYNPAGEGFFDADSQSVINIKGSGGSVTGFVQQIFLNRATGVGELLSSIVSDISSRVGLTPATDLDVTELTDVVRGYIVTRQMPARSAIEPLGVAFFFDSVESDGKVKFIKRGNDSIRTLLDDDLVEIDRRGGDVVKEERFQEAELPERLSVTFMDINTDYEIGSAPGKRIVLPRPTMFAHSKTSIALPIVFTMTEAKQIAEILLFTAWNERISYNWRTSWEELDLDPADVVTLSLGGGATLLQPRIIDATVNQDMSISFRGLKEDKITFISDSIGQEALGFPQQLPPAPKFTRLFLMDIPLLRDQDDVGRSSSRLHFAMNGFVDGWTGGVLWDSPAGITFTNTGLSLFSGITYGTVSNVLPDTPTPFLTDTTTVLNVVMQQGALTTITQAQFLNNVNVAVIGDPTSPSSWEIILFRDAVEGPDGVFAVSTILRGRRGTDKRVADHSTGEMFIVLQRSDIATMLLSIGLLNINRFYRGVGFNQILEEADTETLASTMADLKPYAPVHLDAVVDGGNNIDISWKRRTRVGGELRGGTGTVPLSEDTESYDIDILDQPNPGATVLRTLTSVVNSVQYDNADIVTDFGSVPATIDFIVHQISAQVDRGFGQEANITF